MKARNHILVLVAAAALLSTTSAMAQTEGKLFEGASTYYLNIVTNAECDLSEDFIRQKALFPLSYSDLSEGNTADSDIWITINVSATKMRGLGKCFGMLTVTSEAILWSGNIPFNKKTHWSEIPLFRGGKTFTGFSGTEIGDLVEDLMKNLVTAINLDNK